MALEFQVLNDRHVVTAAEAAYVTGLGKTFFPDKAAIAQEVNPVCSYEPVIWWLYSFVVFILNSSEVWKQGVAIQLEAPVRGDTGHLPLVRGIQRAGIHLVAFQSDHGFPLNWGIRWRIFAGGTATDDLVIARAMYLRGLVRP